MPYYLCCRFGNSNEEEDPMKYFADWDINSSWDVVSDESCIYAVIVVICITVAYDQL